MTLLKLLPVEVLLAVCEYLGDTNMENVVVFALVCKKCESVAKTVLYRIISFVVTSQTRLESDIRQCRSRLQRDAGFGCVRFLEIAGAGPYHDESDIHHPAAGWRFMSQSEYDSLSPLPDQKLLEGDHLFSLGLDHRIGQVKIWETVSNEAWQALASFIAQLPALSDLVYDCASAVPPCILDALHQTGCRLHVNTFRVPALKTALDADFIQLITSSSLSSIRAAYLPTASRLAVPGLETELIYEEDTLRRIVAGSAANLRSVTIIRKARGVDPSIASPPPCPEYKLAGLRLPQFQRGSLHELALLHQHVVSASDIESWQAHTDFWVLVVLRISARISLDALNVLSSVDLPSLESLSLTVHKSSGSTDIITAVNHFLLAVRPVRKLCLEKTIQILSLVQIVEHHGSTLRRLCLLPSKEYTACNTQWSDHYLPSATMLSAITRFCPLIEDLAITVRRSKGSSEEVQMYRVLGSLPKLQSLSLTLDASDYSLLWFFEAFTNNLGGATRNWPPPPDDKSFDDFERDLYPQVFIGGGPVVRNGHVRDVFINCAVDQRLALAIFNAICYSGQANRSRLRNLTLNTIGGGSFTPYTDLPSSLATVVDEISHSWKITRNSSSEGQKETSSQLKRRTKLLVSKEFQTCGGNETWRNLPYQSSEVYGLPLRHKTGGKNGEALRLSVSMIGRMFDIAATW